MKRYLVVAAGALLFAMGALACDDDDTLDVETPSIGDGTPAADDGTPEGSPSGAGTPGTGEIVEINADSPGESLSISAGDPVTFVNNSDDSVTVSIDGQDESGELQPGDSFEFTFDDPGEYTVTVDSLPGFIATITVQ